MFENFVYVIRGINTSNKIKYYIGYTNNPQRRIRQHNREIVGGAKSTAGYRWEYCAIIANFRDNIEGLQIEWRLKYSTKKTNIVNRFNSFFNYIDTNLNASPNNNIMKKKLFLYIDNTLLPQNKQLTNPLNVILIYTKFNDEIINHINN
jgi:predicted GIY-YIG superfamily endonuclease